MPTTPRPPYIILRPLVSCSVACPYPNFHLRFPVLRFPIGTRLTQSGGSTDVPADVLERMRRTYVASAVRNMELHGHLRKVLRRLRDSGVNVIVLKGAYLGEAVYGDYALRPMADVDLMVPRAELSRASVLLLDKGSVHGGPAYSELPARGKRPGPFAGSGIDIHWTLDIPGGRSRLDVGGLWSRAVPVSIAGVEVLTLCPEDLLLHLCLHAAFRHGLGDGLRPICDVAETAQRFHRGLKWSQLVGRAHEWGASRYVGLMLCLARNLLHANVPDEVIEQLVPEGIEQRLFAAARESVLAQTGYLERMPFFRRLGARSLGEKARLASERLFLSRGEMAARYPAARDSRHLYIYYLLRLKDLVRTYLRHVTGRAGLPARKRDPNAILLRWLKSGKS
ncbi:nucleotidyltransferase family protein [candidate division WOR-3 bacterium]|nr:nucleotidyltransferase family protein [candidate division WOR-3 bacterium]